MSGFNIVGDQSREEMPLTAPCPNGRYVCDPHRCHKWIISSLCGDTKCGSTLVYARDVVIPDHVPNSTKYEPVIINFYSVPHNGLFQRMDVLEDLIRISYLSGTTRIAHTDNTGKECGGWLFHESTIRNIVMPKIDYRENDISIIKVVLGYNNPEYHSVLPSKPKKECGCEDFPGPGGTVACPACL